MVLRQSPTSALFSAGRDVPAVARHRDDLVFLLQGVDDTHLLIAAIQRRGHPQDQREEVCEPFEKAQQRMLVTRLFHMVEARTGAGALELGRRRATPERSAREGLRRCARTFGGGVDWHPQAYCSGFCGNPGNPGISADGTPLRDGLVSRRDAGDPRRAENQ
jgi:hypothetical protein